MNEESCSWNNSGRYIPVGETEVQAYWQFGGSDKLIDSY